MKGLSFEIDFQLKILFTQVHPKISKFSRYLFTPMLIECLERRRETVFQRSTEQLK